MSDKLLGPDYVDEDKRRKNSWMKLRDNSNSAKSRALKAIAATNRHAAKRPITLPALSCLADDPSE